MGEEMHKQMIDHTQTRESTSIPRLTGKNGSKWCGVHKRKIQLSLPRVYHVKCKKNNEIYLIVSE